MNGEEQEEEEVIATGAVFNESESTTFSIPYVATTELVWLLIDTKYMDGKFIVQ